jgi:hypothetical protein
LFPIESTFDLSEDEYRRVQCYADELFSLWTRTDENDVQAVESALVRMYARERCPAPFIVWCDSPWEMHLMPSLLDSMTEETRFQDACSPLNDPITNAFNRALSKAQLTWPAAWQARVIQIVGAQRVAQWRESCARARLLMAAKLSNDVQNHSEFDGHSLVWGRWAADLLPVYATPALALASGDWGQELLAQLADLFTLRTGAFGYVFRHCSVFVCKNPTVINLDANNRLHCDDGPAVQFSDGYSLYSWAGVHIDPDLVLRPESLTIERIDNEANIELRRVMIDKFGAARYIEEGNALVVAEDECGVLLRKEVPGDEPIVLVKVINSSPEPDGTYRSYFLRVPPDMTQPREAVAWTFGLHPEEYMPDLET